MSIKPTRLMKCLSGAIGNSQTERLINKVNNLYRRRSFIQCAGNKTMLEGIDKRIEQIIKKIDEIDKELEIEASKPLFD